MTKFKSLLQLSILGILVYPFTQAQAQVNAASCNTSDVQTAINQATEGQTVNIPAGTCTWTSGVTISGKGLIIKGAGAGRIIAYSPTPLSIGTGSKTLSVTSTLVSGSLAISNGQTLTISETGNRQNHMVGTVSSYSSGNLTMNITSSGGACGNSSAAGYQSPSNCKRWLISTPPSTVIVNNSTAAQLFNVTEDSSVHTNLSGFKVAAGTGSAAAVHFAAGGGKAIVLHDCWIESNASSMSSIEISVNRGVISNCSFDSTPYSMSYLAVHMQPYDFDAWNTNPSYFGTADTDGQHNIYVETSDFHAFLNAGDVDEGTRAVFRYNLFDHSGFGTHGADTSTVSGRYFDYYKNKGNFQGYSDGTTLGVESWFFVRGGTFLIHDNDLPALVSTDYGTKSDARLTVMNLQRNAGYNACWGAGTSGGAMYSAPQQVGMGRVTGTGRAGNGSTTYASGSFYVGDPEPAYIWNNSRSQLNVAITDFGGTDCSNPDSSVNYIKLNRDYFNGSTAKPGYTPYTYPHPLVSGSQQQASGGPAAPINLTAVVN